MRWFIPIALAILYLIITYKPTPENTFTGEITRIVDGDTIVVAAGRGKSATVRIWGIDAPEVAHPKAGKTEEQTCEVAGVSYDCGREAKAALEKLAPLKTGVACEVHDVDRYQRVVARCSRGATDLGRSLVAQGWAVSYSVRTATGPYAAEERAARSAKVGIWRGEFEPPAAFRRRQNHKNPL